MSRTLFWLAPHESDLPVLFEEYLKETTGLTLGSDRLLWDRKTLAEKDLILEEINQRFRNRVFDACWILIDRLAEK